MNATIMRASVREMPAADVREHGFAAAIVRLTHRVADFLAFDDREIDAVPVLDDERWFVRPVRGGGVEVVPYRRGSLAFSTQAAQSLLSLGSGDLLRVRAVLDSLARSAVDDQSHSKSGALFVAADSIVVADYPQSGPRILVTQLA
jgi:hypothetical protein